MALFLVVITKPDDRLWPWLVVLGLDSRKGWRKWQWSRLTTVVWRGTQKLEEPCFGIEFQTSYLMRQTGCSCAHKPVMCKHTYLLFHFCFIRGHKWNVSQHSCLNHVHLSTTAVSGGLPLNGNRDHSVWLCEKLWHDCEWLNDFKN